MLCFLIGLISTSVINYFFKFHVPIGKKRNLTGLQPSMPTTHLLSFGLIALLIACGDVNSGHAANATTPLPVDPFHGLVVPPDPGAAANATVAGVDTNQNGIRDEVDRYIAQTYGEEPTKFVAAQAVAKADQLLLVTPTTDVNAATAAVYANADSGVCLADKFENDPVAATRMSNDIVLRTFNNRDRQKQFQAILTKVGQFTRSTEGVICQ